MFRLFIILPLIMLPRIAFSDQKNGKLVIQKIDENVFLHTSYMKLAKYGYYPSNGLVVIDGDDAYIIDTPWLEEDTLNLVEWIKSSGLTLKASISTHFHDDRASGIAYLNKQSIKTYASAITNQLLESVENEKATLTFEGPEFSLHKGLIEVYYPGAGHSQDNIVIWLPQSKMLFGGCLIRSLSSQGMGNTADASLDDWAFTVKKVMDKFPDIERVVPGHGKLGGTELLTHTIHLATKTNMRGTFIPN